MSSTIIIRDAAAGEAAHLSDLALRSKAHWGYSPAFLSMCVEELTVQSCQIDDEQIDVVVAERNDEVVGFYVLARASAATFELDALFVEPAQIGSGVGRSLVRHALGIVAAKSGNRLLIQGDPHAKRFYLAAGATMIGSRESNSVPGRLLPLFEIVI